MLSLRLLAVSDHVSLLLSLLKMVMAVIRLLFASVAGSHVDCVDQLVGLECSVV